jgi:hypothetical protein
MFSVRRLYWLVLVCFLFTNTLSWSAETQFARAVNEQGGAVMEMGVTRYVNPRTGITVTLIPVAHVGEQSFYDAVEKILEAQDTILYEGIRPPGFSGPPFENDPEMTTYDQYVERTKIRISAIGNIVKKYKQKKGKAAVSWDEVIGEKRQYLVDTLLFNAWGTPIRLEQLPNGDLDVATDIPVAGNKVQELRYSQLPPYRFPLLLRLLGSIGKYDFLAKLAKLDSQQMFPVLARAGSYNVDVSVDQVFGLPLWQIGELPARWQARNMQPIKRLKEILADANIPKKNIGIIYGAAHAVDFHKALTATLGYQVADQTWLPIIHATDAKVAKDPTAQSIRAGLIKKLSSAVKPGPDCAAILAPQPSLNHSSNM